MPDPGHKEKETQRNEEEKEEEGEDEEEEEEEGEEELVMLADHVLILLHVVEEGLHRDEECRRIGILIMLDNKLLRKRWV